MLSLFRWPLFLLACLPLLLSLCLPVHGQGKVRLLNPSEIKGSGSYPLDAWGMLRLGVENSTDEDHDILVSITEESDKSKQYGRQMMLPAGTRRYASYYLKFPQVMPKQYDDKGEEVENTMLDLEAFLYVDGELQVSDTGARSSKTLVAIDLDPPAAVMLVDEEDDEAKHLVAAVREAHSLPTMVPILDPDWLPTSPLAFDGIQQITVSSNRLLDDPAAMAALRGWVMGGGRLWLMLNEVQPEVAYGILGDSVELATLDHLSLSSFQVKSLADVAQPRHGEEKTLQQPATLLRVVATGGETLHTIDDWPASIWVPMGEGGVMLTTVSGRAWYRPAREDDVRPDTRRKRGEFVAEDPLRSIADYLFRRADGDSFDGRPPKTDSIIFDAADNPVPVTEKPAMENVWQSHADQDVGYEILSRGKMAGFLGGYLVALIVFGIALFKTGKLPWLGVVAPALALVMSGGLMAVSWSRQSAVPSTLSRVQIADVNSATGDIRLVETSALYTSDARQAPPVAEPQTFQWPDLKDGENLVWTDIDRAKWFDRELPAGITPIHGESWFSLVNPPKATVKFGADGLEGKVSGGDFGELGDVFLYAPSRRQIALNLDKDGNFTAADTTPLIKTQFIDSTTVTDTQRDRQEMLRVWLGKTLPENRHHNYYVIGWAEPYTSIYQLDVERDIGQLLVMIPVDFEAPPANETWTLPAAVLPYRTFALNENTLERSPGGASTFDPKKFEWVGAKTDSTNTWLAITAPAAVQPAQFQSAKIKLNIVAPDREVQLKAVSDKEIKVLKTWQSPTGLVEFSIDDPEFLVTGNNGDLAIGISVSAANASGEAGAVQSIQDSSWYIEDFQVEVTGKTVPPTE